MARKKKDLIVENVTITGIADKGRGIGRTAEGQVVFVESVAPDDVVDVRISKQKNGYFEGYPVAYKTLSNDRVEPFCSHFSVCGGCKWQHLSYEAQLRHKQLQTESTIKHLAKVPVGEFMPILGSNETEYYRNKLEFAFSNKRWLTNEEMTEGISNQQDVLGFHRAGAFDKILNIDHCYLQAEPHNKIRNTMRKLGLEQRLTFFDMREQVGFLRNTVIRVTTLGQTMVIVSFGHEDKEKRENYLNELLRRCPEITALFYCINTKANDFILDLDIITYFGKDYIEEDLGDVRFRIGPKSFFQTNTRQATRLFQTVADFADFKGTENVYDLYTGIGSIALFIAKKVKQVVGIEEIAAAIEDAKSNAERNGLLNTTFYAGDVKNILSDEFAEKHGKPDILITDPPRAGMHASVVQMLLRLAAPKLIYVSCNPATQARDLQLLDEKYEVQKICPVDMFPHTHHVENIALLTLKKL